MDVPAAPPPLSRCCFRGVRQAASRTHAEGLGGASLELLQMVCEALDHVAMARDPLRGALGRFARVGPVIAVLCLFGFSSILTLSVRVRAPVRDAVSRSVRLR